MSSKIIQITPDVSVSVFDDGRIEVWAPRHDLKLRRGGSDPRPDRGSRYSFTVEPRQESGSAD